MATHFTLTQKLKPLLTSIMIAGMTLFPASAFAESAAEDAIDALVDPVIEQDTPGMAVLVMKDGEVILMKGYGVKNIESEEPVDENTIFDLASVSKEMTAMAAMLLISEDKLSEDQPVSDILPEFAKSPIKVRPITVEDLIHHKSGLVDYIGDENSPYTDDSTNAEVVSWLATRPLQWAPGTKFEYSNSGYVTLGSSVMAADGAKSLKDVLQARIWEPLGMSNTGLVHLADDADPTDRVTGYKGTQGNFVENSQPTVVEGDGNILTNIKDLALYENALANNTLLSEEATDALFENTTLDNGKPLNAGEGDGYGFGWYISKINGLHFANHSGSWMGTSTFYQRNLDTGVTVILLANGEDISLDDLAMAIDEAVSNAQ